MNNYSFNESMDLVNDLEGLLNGFKIPNLQKMPGGKKSRKSRSKSRSKSRKKSRRKSRSKSRRKSRYK